MLVAELRSVLRRDDDYASAGKPVCDWDDGDARVDALARDGYALLAAGQHGVERGATSRDELPTLSAVHPRMREESQKSAKESFPK